MRNLSFFALLFIIGCSCSEKLVPKEAVMLKVLQVDPSAKLVVPKDITAGVKCADYGEGCLHGHEATVLGLEMIFLEFASRKAAKDEALRIDGYYFENWVLDDVTGEPLLEKFVEKNLGAIRARPKEKSK